MAKDSIPIRQFIKNYRAGLYKPLDVKTQCNAGWYDWFCKGTLLPKKTITLADKLLSLLPSYKIDIDKQYVFFKNNCPMAGNLYDSFSVCDLETGDVVLWVTPHNGHWGDDFGKAQVYAVRDDPDAKAPIINGTWRDVVKFFKEI